ncbi:hypothetical protein AMTR_s00150p00053680 [Amborella trichopoda]|uniref:Uncharacterized protein n=1 Tax=Amborella trichopoda TaxID=13333 RepID=W1PKA1_AMBTC|nr:hypothetical protein AMTR_s00150p00053680 [Amborella trichopoda]
MRRGLLFREVFPGRGSRRSSLCRRTTISSWPGSCHREGNDVPTECRGAILLLRIGVHRYIEVYNPHQFARQQRIDQGAPWFMSSPGDIIGLVLILRSRAILAHVWASIITKRVYKTYTYYLWYDNHQRDFHKTLLIELPPMREHGILRTHYKSRTTNVDVEWATRTQCLDNWNIVSIEHPVGPLVQEDVLAKTNASFYHYLEKLLGKDPRVSKGPGGPFIRDLNKLVEVKAADPCSAPVEKSKGKRPVMNPPATTGRLALNHSSKKKRKESSPSPPQDKSACEPLAKKKSLSPSKTLLLENQRRRLHLLREKSGKKIDRLERKGGRKRRWYSQP